jgi:hypothetical protein
MVLVLNLDDEEIKQDWLLRARHRKEASRFVLTNGSTIAKTINRSFNQLAFERKSFLSSLVLEVLYARRQPQNRWIEFFVLL